MFLIFWIFNINSQILVLTISIKEEIEIVKEEDEEEIIEEDEED